MVKGIKLTVTQNPLKENNEEPCTPFPCAGFITI